MVPSPVKTKLNFLYYFDDNSGYGAGLPYGCACVRSMVISFLRRFALTFVHIALVLAVLSFAGTAHGAIINEPMNGATAPGWVIGGSAYLTASSGVDPAGDGWLRLTDLGGNEAGYAYLNTAFDISQGAVIQFDYVTWGGAGDGGFGCGTTGADGYSIFLFDGAQSFSVGGSGGSLGYANNTGTGNPGLSYGYIGTGIDEWGNFSNPTEGRLGGPGGRCNAVAVRGPYNHPTGAYYYLGGTASNIAQLAFPGQAFRPGQTGPQYRKVLITLTPQAAPNYLRMDVYVQVGYDQFMTQVLNGLMVGRPIPATVKIGYAASTGGSNNYHEIRNLIVDPLPSSDIDLTIAKFVSAPTVTAGGPITYTVTVRNNGPSNVTANNVPINDTVPAIVTGVTWTCTGAGGATCGAGSGSGNTISTSVNLPLNSSATYTITGVIDPVATPGTQITNTATLTVPGGITDYNSTNNAASVTMAVTAAPISISGMVYNDSGAGGGTAHNGVRDGTEGSTAQTMYAKLFRAGDLTTALQVYTIGAAGTYVFNNVPSYDNYTIIISNVNNTSYNPAPPSNNWVYTGPDNYTLDLSAGGSNLTSQNFGLWNGSRVSGKVIKDDGLNGALANANDGVLNAAETGIAGITVALLDNAAPNTVRDTTTTDSGGNFALFTNVASRQMRIAETNAAGYLSVSFNAGTTGGTYLIGADYISFAYVLYTDYSNILFGDVPDNTFAPAMNGATTTAPATVYYAHTFTPGSGGSVTVAVNGQTQTWTKAYYRDNNCDGTYDGGDTLIAGALTASAGVPICILLQETVPAGAPGVTDSAVTRATFTFTNSVGPVVQTYDVTDSTSVVGVPAAGNKPLYLYDNTSTPAYKLSRTPMTVNAGSFVAIPRGNVTQSWTLSPALQSPVLINANIPVQLWLSTDSSRTYNIPVTLLCGATTVATVTVPVALTNGAAPALFPFTLVLGGAYTCPAGSSWILNVTNTQGAGGAARNIRVYPAPATGNYSNVSLPSQNVINVDSVNAYSSPYPATTTPPSGAYTPGNTVYVRAVVSDPFGSYDIVTAPTITIREPANTIKAFGAMTLVNDSGASTKTFEFTYTLLASDPTGTWNISVIAREGTEGTVSHANAGAFRVAVPSITAVKAVSTYSDPYNNTTNPKSIPGAVMLYTLTVINSGLGFVDANTMTVTDPIPVNTSMCVSALCSNPPVTFTCSAAPACGLTYSYATAVAYTNQPGGIGPYNYTPVPDASGYDAAVTGFRVNPAGAFNGVAGPPYSQFTIQFRVKIK
jgi:uncharacterized repeat protein (TIGR01451 family)